MLQSNRKHQSQQKSWNLHSSFFIVEVVCVFIFTYTLVCMVYPLRRRALHSYHHHSRNNHQYNNHDEVTTLLKVPYDQIIGTYKIVPSEPYCQSTRTLIVVISCPSCFTRRNIIRNTWGNANVTARLGMAVIFLLGNTSDDNVQDAIKRESQSYNDIVQGYFIDSYRNLTYKTLTMFHWLLVNCPPGSVQYIIKTDDDMLLNVYSIARYLNKINVFSRREDNAFHCAVRKNSKVERNTSSKYYVTEKEYPNKFYVKHCLGAAYIMPYSIVKPLYNASFNTSLFWLEDVYTGMLAQNANITYVDISKFYGQFVSDFIKKIIASDAMFGLSIEKDIPHLWTKIETMEMNFNKT